MPWINFWSIILNLCHESSTFKEECFVIFIALGKWKKIIYSLIPNVLFYFLEKTG